jgi:hypothetical protein
MSDFNRGISRPAPIVADMGVDAGLRAFMLGVYNKMGLGLLLTAALAWLTSAYPPVRDLFYQMVSTPRGEMVTPTMLGWIVMIAPLPVMLFGQFAVKQSPRSSGIIYWTVVALFGASLGIWGLLYTAQSIFMTFLVTASAFGGLSLIGYTTKRDLTGLGSFMMMGLFGLIIASVVSFFVHASILYFLINVLGVFIFAGLIAFQTQRLKLTYYQLGGDASAMAVATNYGALTLYLDFLNLFLFLLRLMGGRR